jgi:integrase
MKIYLINGPAGIYYARFEKPDGKWTKRSLKTTNEAAAKVKLGELALTLKKQGWDVPAAAESPKLSQVIPAYLVHIRKRKSIAWAEKQRQYFNRTFTAFFGKDTLVGAISPGRIEAYANHRSDAVRGVTVNRELSCLRSFFKWCKAQGYVLINPAAQIEFMDDEVQIVRRFLSLEEYEFLVRFASDLVENDPYFHIGKHFRDLPEFLEFGCHTGLRLGEILHAGYSDVVNGTLLVRPKPQYKFRIKNHKERQIPLDRQARNAIESMRSKRASDSDPIFWQHGQNYTRKHRLGISSDYNTAKRDVQVSFARLIEKARKDKPSLTDVGPHTLRKTFGSWAVQGGASLQQVKELLGHSTIQITERHYAYLAPRNLQEAV